MHICKYMHNAKHTQPVHLQIETNKTMRKNEKKYMYIYKDYTDTNCNYECQIYVVLAVMLIKHVHTHRHTHTHHVISVYKNT